MTKCSIEAHGQHAPEATHVVIDSRGFPYMYLCPTCHEAFSDGQDVFDLVVEEVQPEVKSDKPESMIHKEKHVIDVEEIDDLLEEGYIPESFVGMHLVYHDDKQYPLMMLGQMLVAAIDHECYKCGQNPVALFHSTGLHSGAWCYAYDFNGNYIANFRDQCYLCEVCQSKLSA